MRSELPFNISTMIWPIEIDKIFITEANFSYKEPLSKDIIHKKVRPNILLNILRQRQYIIYKETPEFSFYRLKLEK